MKPIITLLLTCPLLLASGVASSFNQDLINIQSSIKTQEQIDMLRQPKTPLKGYPAVTPDMLDEFGPDREKSPDGLYVDKNAKPKEPFGPVAIPGPFHPTP